MLKLHLVVFITAFLISYGTRVHSETLTLDKVLKSVEQSHPNIAAAQRNLDKTSGSLQALEGQFDTQLSIDSSAMPAGYYDSQRYAATITQPTKFRGLSFFGTYSITNGDWPIYDGKLVTNNGGEVRSGFSLPLLRESEIDAQRTSLLLGQIQENIAQDNIEAVILKNKLEAGYAYFNWLNAGLKRDVYKRLYKTALVRTKQLEERLKAGDIADFDLIDNQRAQLQRETQLNESEQKLYSSALTLSLFHRNKSGLPLVPKDQELPNKIEAESISKVMPLNVTQEKAFANRPELKILNKKMAQTKQKQNLANNDLLPNIDFEFFSAHNMGEGLIENSRTDVYTGLRLNVPLQRNEARGKLAESKSEELELEQMLTFAKENVVRDLTDSWQAIKQSRERIKLAEQEYQASKHLEDGEQAKFVLGESNLIFINIREQTTAEAAIRLIDAQTEYYKSLLSYKATSAEL